MCLLSTIYYEFVRTYQEYCLLIYECPEVPEPEDEEIPFSSTWNSVIRYI